ncbi:MAG: alginate export family protein [Dissulfuribacterales bacterium]
MKKILLLMLILFLAAPAYAINIADNVDFGGEVRLRGYDFQNFWTFDYQDDVDNYSTFRLRSSLYAKVTLDNGVSGFIKLSNQTYGEGLSDYEDNKSDKVFIDNAYIDVKKLFNTSIDLRAGRQNLMYGTGFVLFDGQSQFASTSFYFDGIKLSFPLGDNAVVDCLYFKDQENDRADWINPKIANDPEDDDITLTGAYITAHCPVIGGQQELYALNREDENSKKDITMYGLRLSDKFDFGLDYSGEIAFQTGDAANGEDQEALGYKLQAGYTLDCEKMLVKPRFFIGYTSLEGDGSDTDDYEGWDVFYGGWPQFGDLLAWMYVNIPPNKIGQGTTTVPGEATYTNLNMATVGVSSSFKKLFVEASYTNLQFEEDLGSYGDEFGDYYQLKASYAYTKNLSFSMYAAMIEPGDAFEDQGMNDEAYEFYWETRLKF